MLKTQINLVATQVAADCNQYGTIVSSYVVKLLAADLCAVGRCMSVFPSTM